MEYLSILKKIFRVCLFHFGSDHTDGTGEAFYPKTTAFSGHFSVGMYPQRRGSGNGHPGGGMRIDPLNKIVFTEKGCGQGKQHQSFGNITYRAQIQHAVMIVGGGTEHKTAALVAVTHTGDEQKAWKC